MSRRYRFPYWLLATGLLGTALFLAASNHRAPSLAQVPAAEGASAPRTSASVPAHLGVAANYTRRRYIVQAGSAAAAGDAVLQVGGAVTGDLSVIRAVAAELNEQEMTALRAA